MIKNILFNRPFFLMKDKFDYPKYLFFIFTVIINIS
jgi:hypothetical protein